MTHAEHNANPATTPKTGLLASLCARLHAKGTGASKIGQGNGAPSSRRAAVALAALTTMLGALAFAAAPALAAPEEPKTKPATVVTGTSATLNGELNPKVSGTAGFEFAYNTNGTCTEGSTTPLGAEKVGKAIKVSSAVTGLVPSTQYTFCVVATHQEGETTETTSGAPEPFTTPDIPPAVDAESTTGVNAKEATLKAQVNPNNQETTVVLEYAVEEAMLGTVGATKLEGGTLAGFGDQAAVAGTGPVLLAGTTYAYRAVATNAKAEKTVGPVAHFTAAITPQAPLTGSPAASITTESAVLEGVLNPGGAGNAGTYEFLYRESASECEGERASAQEAMTGAAGQAVTATVGELLPGATYTFCLLARNEAGETMVGNKVHFTALPVKATIEEGSLAATNLTKSSADLTAKINPNGADTTYRIEYGTSTAYSSSTPLADIGAGRSQITVTQNIPIKPNVTYHWRLIASSAAGTATSTDQTFVDGTAGVGLPDGRQYELVTPTQKNGALISAAFGSNSAWPPRIARSGADIITHSTQCFADAESCSADRSRQGEPYEFARTSQGWVTHPLAPPTADFEINTLWDVDADQRTTLFSAPTGPGGGDVFYSRSADGSFTNIGPLAEGLEGSAPGSGSGFRKLNSTVPIVATPDYSHLLFAGNNLWSLEGQQEGARSVYEYVGAGSTTPLLVGVSGGAGSSSLISACGTLVGSGAVGGSVNSEYGSLSADGRTAYFTAAECPEGGTGENVGRAVPAAELYARVDGEGPDAHTVAISAPSASGCESVECQTAPPEDGDFEGASTDGSRVLFTSTQELSDDASQGEGPAGTACATAPGSGCNLYESICTEPCGTPAEEPAAGGRELVDLSAGAKSTGGPRVQGVMAISPDGTHVYFVARGVLTGEQENQGHEKAQDGQNNLYVYAAGQPLRFVATLSESDELEFPTERAEEWRHGIQLANVTPDGRYLVFLSHRALTRDDTRAQGPAQVYRYDSATGTLARISIGRNGYNDDGNAGSADAGIVFAYRGWVLGAGPGVANPTMSDDGSYVFFESPVGLAPGALNEVEGSSGLMAENVYEYHDGNVSLIATAPPPLGTGSKGVELVGTDATGADVFFGTFGQLVPQDTDTQRDYYDARICTNEPCFTPPPTSAQCSEEACRGSSPGSPGSSTPGSESFTGPGNQTAVPGPTAPVKPKPLTRAQKLTKALRACRTKHKRAKRVKCEKAARHQFGAPAKAKKSTRASKDRTASR